MMDIQKIQEKFESLMLANPDFDEDLLEKDEDGDYEDSDIQHMYSMFEAGTEVGKQIVKENTVPDGFVLVPKLSANYIFNMVPNLGFSHQDEKDTVLYHLSYMASEFNDSAKEFVKQDHKAQEQSHG